MSRVRSASASTWTRTEASDVDAIGGELSERAAHSCDPDSIPGMRFKAAGTAGPDSKSILDMIQIGFSLPACPDIDIGIGDAGF
jgi:hypothetical protein